MDADGPEGSSVRKDSKYFRYGVKDGASSKSIAIAIRLPYGNTYSLSMRSDQEGIYCKSDNMEYLSTCKILGATDATNPQVYYRLNL